MHQTSHLVGDLTPHSYQWRRNLDKTKQKNIETERLYDQTCLTDIYIIFNLNTKECPVVSRKCSSTLKKTRADLMQSHQSVYS